MSRNLTRGGVSLADMPDDIGLIAVIDVPCPVPMEVAMQAFLRDFCDQWTFRSPRRD